MNIVRLSTKGQLTLPHAMRSLLGLGKGDELIAKNVDNKIILEPLKYSSLSELFAAVKVNRYISEKELKKIVRARAKKRKK